MNGNLDKNDVKTKKVRFLRPDAEKTADELLDIQKRVGERARVTDMLTIVLCLSMLIVLGSLVFILPEEKISEEENRMLQMLPELNMSVLTDEKFSLDMGEFYADQFPLRNSLVGIKGIAELSMLRYENNGVILGSCGYLIDRIEYTEENYRKIEKNLASIEAFSDYLVGEGIDVTVAIAPRGIDVLSSYLPPYYSGARAERAYEQAEERGLILLKDVFRDAISKENDADGGLQLWYKTDHHWTSQGAYLAYVALSESMGYEPYSYGDFEFTRVSGDFLGTTYSKAGIKQIKPEAVYFPRFSGDENFITEISESKRLRGFYDYSYLEKKDKYSAFIGGNNPIVRVTLEDKTDGEAENRRETLLIVKDSFSHSLVPFLARHYDLILVDPRYYIGDYSIEVLGYDRALILFGIDCIATQNLGMIVNVKESK